MAARAILYDTPFARWTLPIGLPVNDPEILVILTDDWELRGDGQGDVGTLQFSPAMRLMDLYDEIGVPATFNAEVMQQLAFEAHAAAYPEIAMQRDLWLNGVRTMVRRGFDVQLHIHPQWLDAAYDGQWHLDGRWHLADYSRVEVQSMLGRSTAYLAALIDPKPVVAFRAGSWGMGPPSRHVIEALLDHGIVIDVSVVNGCYYDGEAIRLDYSMLDSPDAAYWPDLDDIRRRSAKFTGLTELPTQSAEKCGTGPRLLAEYVWAGMQARFGRFAHVRGDSVPANCMLPDPFGFRSGTAREHCIADLSGRYSTAALSALLLQCIARARRKSGAPVRALVFENHTKNLQTDADFERIASVLKSVRRRYPEVAFVTLRDVAARAGELV